MATIKVNYVNVTQWLLSQHRFESISISISHSDLDSHSHWLTNIIPIPIPIPKRAQNSQFNGLETFQFLLVHIGS